MQPDNKSMTGRWFIAGCILLFILLLSTGCTSLSIGNLVYNNGNVTVAVSGLGNPVTAGVEVHIFSIEAIEQHELLVTGITTTLHEGNNLVSVPVNLTTGKYKIYVYLVVNGERETAAIRDISV